MAFSTDNRTANNRGRQKESSEVEERVVNIKRCSKVVKGGRRFSFSALVVAGDRNGRVGYALGHRQEDQGPAHHQEPHHL